jgi:hypothetical protein
MAHPYLPVRPAAQTTAMAPPPVIDGAGGEARQLAATPDLPDARWKTSRYVNQSRKHVHRLLMTY